MATRTLAVLLFCAVLALLPGCKGKTPPAPGSNLNEVRQFHEAVRDGDVEIVRRLLGARPYLANARDDKGTSPLQAAKQGGSEEMADLIRQKGGRE